jgi:excinuclease ABC subunit C
MPRTVPARGESDALAVLAARVKSEAENRPGVYRMIAEDGEVLYVGKSKQLRARLMSHLRAQYPEEKSARIVREAARIEWQYTPSEFAALLEELRCIKRERPRFNVALKRDARHYAFIKLTRGTAPKLMVVRGAGRDDSSVYYGPFVGAQRLEEAIRELSDALGLRDCSQDRKMYFSDQGELFVVPARTPGCLRWEVGKCLGPCIGASTSHAYTARVNEARAFLDGESDGPMERLHALMLEASERMEFERAASFRDKHERLVALREQFARLRFAIESLSFGYLVSGHDGEDRLYLIRRGRVRAELEKPRAESDWAVVREVASEVFARTQDLTRSIPSHEIDEMLVVASWFRMRPGEMATTIGPELLT